MINKIILLLFAFGLAVVCHAQTTDTLYFKTEWPYPPNGVPQKKANYVQTITHDTDGTVTTEMKEIKSGQVIRREAYKDGEPVGIWIDQHSSGVDTLDYDFILRYTDKECTNGTLDSLKPRDYFTDNDSLSYVAPRLSNGYSSPQLYLQKNITYPPFARENQIQGRVEVKFTVTPEGKIEDLAVIKGVHKVLDKEVVRIVRNLPLASGASLNGIAQSVCATLPVVFSLDQ